MHLPTFDAVFFLLLATVAISGLVRGFAGFGAGLVFMPVAAAVAGPKLAVIIIWLVDALPTLRLVVPSFAKVRWKSVLPVYAGYAPLLPLGVWWLAHGDVTLLRWAISMAILLAVLILWSGWRYHGQRGLLPAAIAGGLSGLIGGATQLSGPPVLVYWLSGDAPAWQVRANVIVYFFMTTILSGTAMALAGLFTVEAATYALLLAPVYAAGVLAGNRLFPLASETVFRRIAFGLILFAAVSGLPLFDAVLRGG